MSTEVPSPDYDPDDPDSIEALFLPNFDPRLMSILDDVRRAQELIDRASNKSVFETCSTANERLFSMHWIGDKAEVTGKVRPAPWCDDEEFDDEFIAKYGLVVRKDAKGYYIDADGLMLVGALIDLDREEGDDEDEDIEGINAGAQYVLTFNTKEEFLAVEDDDIAIAELLHNSGDLIMYLDEVTHVEFSQPSLERIEQFLRAHYPEVWQAMAVVNADISKNGDRLLQDLKQFKLPDSPTMTSETRGWIGDYLYGFAGIESDTPYRFTLDGEIAGLSLKHDLINKVYSAGAHLRGVIRALHVSERTSRIEFVIAERSAKGGYEGRFVPIDSVVNLQNKTPRQRRFGKIAMMSFDSPDEFDDMWRKWRENLSSEVTVGLQNDDNPNDPFAYWENKFGDELPFTYNVEHGFYETSLTQEMSNFLKAHAEHRKTVAELAGQVEVDESELLSKFLNKELSGSSELKLDDEIITVGKGVLLIPQPDTLDHDVELIRQDERIRGKFLGLIDTEFPSRAMIKSDGRVRTTERGLGLVISDAVCLGDESDRSYDTEFIIIRIPKDRKTRFSKIEYDQPPGEASA